MNEELRKRRRAKIKTYLKQGRSLRQQEVEELQDDRDIIEQVKHEMQRRGIQKLRDESRARNCNRCDITEHNTRTC